MLRESIRSLRAGAPVSQPLTSARPLQPPDTRTSSGRAPPICGGSPLAPRRPCEPTSACGSERSWSDNETYVVVGIAAGCG